MRSSKCNKDNPSDASFCEGCGTKLELICPACKASVSPGARFCKKCGTALFATRPDSHQAGPSESPIRVTADSGSASGAIEGEPKMVTALFADIKGSTELMESLDPEQASAIVDPVLRIMVNAVRHFDGYVVQSTGDCIFSLFGAPVAHEDHPQRHFVRSRLPNPSPFETPPDGLPRSQSQRFLPFGRERVSWQKQGLKRGQVHARTARRRLGIVTDKLVRTTASEKTAVRDARPHELRRRLRTSDVDQLEVASTTRPKGLV
jgi:class 3 adenylate cyclase/ribosomal protein L40E